LSVKLLRAIDRERIGQAQVAERHHLLAEARRHLAHLLDRAGRRERLDGGLRERRQRQAKHDHSKQFRQCAHDISR
jgi:hypothetical protein